MAEALGEAPSSVQGWKNVGRIPATKQPHVLAVAERLGLDVTPFDIIFPLSTRPARPVLPAGLAAVRSNDAPAFDQARRA